MTFPAPGRQCFPQRVVRRDEPNPWVGIMTVASQFKSRRSFGEVDVGARLTSRAAGFATQDHAPLKDSKSLSRSNLIRIGSCGGDQGACPGDDRLVHHLALECEGAAAGGPGGCECRHHRPRPRKLLSAR
jgi:hypothetical protein